MTLPETLKAARIEAIARAVVAVKCGLQSDQFGVRLPEDIWMQGNAICRAHHRRRPA